MQDVRDKYLFLTSCEKLKRQILTKLSILRISFCRMGRLVLITNERTPRKAKDRKAGQNTETLITSKKHAKNLQSYTLTFLSSNSAQKKVTLPKF